MAKQHEPIQQSSNTKDTKITNEKSKNLLTGRTQEETQENTQGTSQGIKHKKLTNTRGKTKTIHTVTNAKRSNRWGGAAGEGSVADEQHTDTQGQKNKQQEGRQKQGRTQRRH